MSRTITPLIDRFIAKVRKDPTSDCWNWIGSKDSHGYGQIYIYTGHKKRKVIPAHRASWLIYNGIFLDTLCVLHKCDNPACVNPKHLFLGTKADNSADMIAKNRQKKGEDLPQSKLSWTQVHAIKNCDLPQYEIAAIAGISQAQVSFIKSGKRWKNNNY